MKGGTTVRGGAGTLEDIQPTAALGEKTETPQTRFESWGVFVQTTLPRKLFTNQPTIRLAWGEWLLCATSQHCSNRDSSRSDSIAPELRSRVAVGMFHVHGE